MLFGATGFELLVGQIEEVRNGRLGDLEVRGVSEVKILDTLAIGAAFADNMTYGLAVLDSASTKTPAKIDAGSCNVTDGCLDVSVVGRGHTFHITELEDGVDFGLNQPLQQADFTLMDPVSCLNQFDKERMFYDLVYQYYADFYGCPNLECANKTRIVKRAKYFNDDYIEEQAEYIDAREALFESGKISCLKTLEAGICQGDSGAPVFTKDDILIGVIINNICIFDGEFDLRPVSVTFTAGIIDMIESELGNLAGADASLTKAAVGDCPCEVSKAVAFSPSAFLVLLTSALLTIRTLVYT